MGSADESRDRPRADKVSPGGSGIYRYEEPADEGWRPPAEYGKYAEEIIEQFDMIFPERERIVFHEIVSDLVHIDVNIMKPAEQADFYVIYTTGMSDLPMTLPEEIADRDDLRYAEIFLLMPSSWNPGKIGQSAEEIPASEFWPIHMVKFLARFPHEFHTWLGWGHTMPNGPDYAPICEGTTMGGVVLSQFDGNIGGFETEDGTQINFLMMIPAYQEEIEYKLKYGMHELDKRYNEGKMSMVTDIHRENFCKEFKEKLD